ncbi:hypothetical protein HW555_001247 [Spodoptera exigua]|uniref:Protein kinase domain-containing protein n=1 Tax=Spodoptera exigua TaxID=7107 RepID=A0A835LFM2_SPOEX|nr:hypothetical protein HW555_001247 [Spodoptera exigua]
MPRYCPENTPLLSKCGVLGPMFPGTTEVDTIWPGYSAFQSSNMVDYDELQYLNNIDEGAFAVVHRARDRQTGEETALKQLKQIYEREGFSNAAPREIEI